jgi:hypothetical protein
MAELAMADLAMAELPYGRVGLTPFFNPRN